MLEGKKAPEFQGTTDSGEKIHLKDFRGKWVVLYFYPRDNTPGCTAEAIDFRNAIEQFQQLDAVVIGVSPDPVERHQKFKAKYQLPFYLISDADRAIAEKYGVWKQKKLYGKVFPGIERSTFIIDPNGTVVAEYRKVKVKGHVADVLNTLQRLQEAEKNKGEKKSVK